MVVCGFLVISVLISWVLCGCLWFGGYVNFVENFGFVIVGFDGFARFGGL